ELSAGMILGWARVNPLQAAGREGVVPGTKLPDMALILKNGVVISATEFDPAHHIGLLFATSKEAQRDGVARLKAAHEQGLTEGWGREYPPKGEGGEQ